MSERGMRTLTATLESELWLVERPEGLVLIHPICGTTREGRVIQIKLYAGGRVTVLPSGTRLTIQGDINELTKISTTTTTGGTNTSC